MTNAELVGDRIIAALDELKRLRAVNADLLAVAEFCIKYDGGECLGDHPTMLVKARAAIARAKEQP